MHAHQKQAGFAILLLTVTLLLISTLLILFAARYSALQQKITAGRYANQQAFQAAEAGLEAAIPYFEAHYSAILSNQSGGYLQPYLNSSTQNVSLANGSRYTFVFSNPSANNFRLITITSTGTTADGTASRILVQQIQAYSTGSVPTTTLSTGQNVLLQHSATLNNTETNSNITAGGSVNLNNSAQTTTSAGVSSTASSLGSDVTAEDETLDAMSGAEFFQSIFGVSETTLENAANYNYTNITNTTYNFLNGVTGAIIWINQLANMATINSTTIIGSAAQPVILVINGSLTISDFATIYGLVFSLDPSDTTVIANNASIHGALASTRSLRLSNSAILNYNRALLYVLPATGAAPLYAKVPGSWKDF